jgi:hypothetical protein
MGEISPNLVTLEVAHIFGLLYSTIPINIKFGKNGLGKILGDFFHKLILSPSS